MQHFGDITKISGYEVPIVDCIVGGSPCQDLSVAGKRAGLEGERSGLFMEQIRIVKEMREQDAKRGVPREFIRPRYMVWENVPGAFSSNKGEDFRIVLEEIVKIVEPEANVPMPEKNKWTYSGILLGDGWSVAWRVLDAQFWGTSDKPLPQRRRRIALVADFGGLSAPEILFVRKSVSGDIEPGEQKRKETARDAGEGFSGAVPCTLKIRSGCEGGGKGALIQENKSATLSTLQDQTLFQPVYGFDPQACRDVGQYVLENMANTLTNGTNPGWHNGVAYSIENHPADSRVDIDESGKVQTLTSRMGTGGGNVPMVMETFSQQAFGQYQESNVASAMKQRDYKDATDLVVEPVVLDRAFFNQGQNAQYDPQFYEDGTVPTLVAKGPDAVQVKHIVRRLTPLECERLQGYPDGWTDIGEWVDSKGKKHKEADSPRYKALGNSIALPPWKWVLKRLCACYERDATMASLFDGIGGFPLIWEQLNGKGSCLWASEIEEFPMAVTKIRFGE